jgi:hypothetical protein
MALFSLSLAFYQSVNAIQARLEISFNFFFVFWIAIFTRQSPIIYKAESEKKIETDFPTTAYGIYGLVESQRKDNTA